MIFKMGTGNNIMISLLWHFHEIQHSLECSISYSGNCCDSFLRDLMSNKWRIVGLPCGQFQGESSVTIFWRIRFISFLSRALPIMTDLRQARDANIALTRDKRHVSCGFSFNLPINSDTSGKVQNELLLLKVPCIPKVVLLLKG
jgi:hypothetical protein